MNDTEVHKCSINEAHAEILALHLTFLYFLFPCFPSTIILTGAMLSIH